MQSRIPSFDDTLYRCLHVDREAAPSDIDNAYQIITQDYLTHKTRSDARATANFQQIFKAYTVLSDEQTRKIYDDFGMAGMYTVDLIGEEKFSQCANSRKCAFCLIFAALMTGFCCFCCCCCQTFCLGPRRGDVE